MYLWVGSGVESGMEGLSRTAGSRERPGAFFCGPYLLLLFLDTNWRRRRSRVAHVESHIYHVPEIVYCDSRGFVYGFVLYCENGNGIMAVLHQLIRCM